MRWPIEDLAYGSRATCAQSQAIFWQIGICFNHILDFKLIMVGLRSVSHFTTSTKQMAVVIFRTLYIFTLLGHSSVFVETCDARTLPGSVILVFIPAFVHMYMDKPAGDLLWTNLRVIWGHSDSDQWEPKQYNPIPPRWPITRLEKCQDRQTNRQTDRRFDLETAPGISYQRL